MHSSTLVTAGVYLLFRFYPRGSALLTSIGIFTTLIAGFAAALECDTKKIIALSTLRQLGLIVTSLGLGARSLCFAHLNTHAAFKALLFLAIGSYIHSIYGSQEARSVVTIHSCSPFTFVILVAASISICGFVTLSGWVTKEAILESAFNNIVNLLSLLLFYLGIGLTLVYSLRVTCSLILSSSHVTVLTQTFSCSSSIKGPMLWLVRLSCFQGYFFNLNCISPPSVLSKEDKIVVLGVLLVGILCSKVLFESAVSASAPLFCLNVATAGLSSLSILGAAVRHTEVSAFQGGGLAYLPSILTPISLGTHFISKLTIFLSFSFFLL